MKSKYRQHKLKSFELKYEEENNSEEACTLVLAKRQEEIFAKSIPSVVRFMKFAPLWFVVFLLYASAGLVLSGGSSFHSLNWKQYETIERNFNNTYGLYLFMQLQKKYLNFLFLKAVKILVPHGLGVPILYQS